MMLTAIGMPLHRPNGAYFDGKIGTWQIIEQVPAQRASLNRPAGAIETTPASLTADYFLYLFLLISSKMIGIQLW